VAPAVAGPILELSSSSAAAIVIFALQLNAIRVGHTPLTFEPRDAEFEQRVRSSFARQAIMRTLGVTLEHVVPGEVNLTFPFRSDLTQQHGFLHAGMATAVIDGACGYAALLESRDCLHNDDLPLHSALASRQSPSGNIGNTLIPG
jgi:hypothetical protein